MVGLVLRGSHMLCIKQGSVGKAGRGYHDDLWPPERLLLSRAHFSSVGSHSPGLIPVLGSCKETANLTSSRESLDPKENSKEVPCINWLAL